MAAIATHDLNPAVFFCFFLSSRLGTAEQVVPTSLSLRSLRSQGRVGPRSKLWHILVG